MQYRDDTKAPKGRFLWRDTKYQHCYVQELKQKISIGFFYSDEVLQKIVDQLAPAINESVENST